MATEGAWSFKVLDLVTYQNSENSTIIPNICLKTFLRKKQCLVKLNYKECHNYIGPSGVRALPLAAGINVGGHYFKYFYFFLKILEGGQ